VETLAIPGAATQLDCPGSRSGLGVLCNCDCFGQCDGSNLLARTYHCGNVSSHRMCLFLHVLHPFRDFVWLRLEGPPPGPAIETEDESILSEPKHKAARPPSDCLLNKRCSSTLPTGNGPVEWESRLAGAEQMQAADLDGRR
jgi:hypothetical protein